VQRVVVQQMIVQRVVVQQMIVQRVVVQQLVMQRVIMQQVVMYQDVVQRVVVQQVVMQQVIMQQVVMQQVVMQQVVMQQVVMQQLVKQNCHSFYQPSSTFMLHIQSVALHLYAQIAYSLPATKLFDGSSLNVVLEARYQRREEADWLGADISAAIAGSALILSVLLRINYYFFY
jgi:hypothetical protein